ncbi:hypothetical protein Tco_1325036 [Tanacetum coccineum]
MIWDLVCYCWKFVTPLCFASLRHFEGFERVSISYASSYIGYIVVPLVWLLLHYKLICAASLICGFAAVCVLLVLVHLLLHVSFVAFVVPFIGIVRFHCPFAGLNGCHDGGGNGLTKAYLITHLREIHCTGEAQAITKHSLLTDLVVFERAEVTLKRMGICLCGVCFKTHTLRAKCRHGADFVPPPDIGDGVVRFVIYDLAKPLAPSCSQLDHIDGLLHDQHDGFTLSLLDSLFSKGLRTVKSTLPSVVWVFLGS